MENVLIIYVKNDITNANEQVIAHGVNCMGRFGSGVAGAIRKKYPYVCKQYLALDQHTLGTCQFVEHGGRVWVNAHTQQYYGRDGRQYASLEAIAYCLEEIDAYMEENQLQTIAMPRIGCGLGGLEWQDVELLIRELLKNREVYIYDL